MEIPNIISSNKDFLNKNESKTYNDVVTNNKMVTTENDKHLSTSEPIIFSIQKQEKSNHEFESVIPSVISDVLSFSDYNSYDNEYLNLTQLIRLKKSMTFNYIEYEEVSEDSESEETIEDEDFSFLKEENKYDEHLVLKTDFKKCFFGRYPNIAYNNSTDKVSQILEKSSVCNTMNNQSKIENSMIRMFNYKKNAFPDYRLHSIGKKLSQQYNERNLSSKELI